MKLSKEVKKKKRKLSIQKIFNIASGIFILSCILFYGIRFIKLYKENYTVDEVAHIGDTIKENNQNNDNFKNINGDYYFYGKEENNYVSYSNMLWRIIKVSKDNTVVLALDNSVTSLAKGTKNKFEETHIFSWLNDINKDNTGILEKSLNNMQKYLTYTNTCIDNITNTKNITCKKTTEDTYITIPSLNDYVNTGSSESFLNNEEYYYLTNNEKESTSWCVDKDGKISTSDGTDILGVKPVITIKNTVQVTNGNGTKENPYTFDDSSSLIGSYVKLDNDIWRIYKEEDSIIKLSLDNYLKINGEEITYKYSNNNYYHNDTIQGSLAYYLNKTYLNSLKYKSILEEAEFSNGIYNNTNNYDYNETQNTKVKTKITVLSIGDIILNHDNTNYYLSSGVSKDSNMIYTMQNDFKVYTKVSTTNLKIVPVIAIKKDLLTAGNGTKDSPYEVNYE